MKGLEDFQKEYMVFVRGGKYKKKVFNLEVCKYPVTQSMWENIMGYNPSRFKGANKPVEIVNWWEVLKFCNKLSEKYNLKPVYDLSQEEKGILKIIHLDGEIVEEDKSDFKNTEGFRLLTCPLPRGGGLGRGQSGCRSKYHRRHHRIRALSIRRPFARSQPPQETRRRFRRPVARPC